MESGDACNTRLALGLGFRELEPPSRRRKTQRVLLDQDDDCLLPSLSLGLSEAAGRWASRVDHTGNNNNKQVKENMYWGAVFQLPQFSVLVFKKVFRSGKFSLW